MEEGKLSEVEVAAFRSHESDENDVAGFESVDVYCCVTGARIGGLESGVRVEGVRVRRWSVRLGGDVLSACGR